MRRLAAVALVVGLLGFAAGSPFLFDVHDGSPPGEVARRGDGAGEGERSVYANIGIAAGSCRPDVQASSSTGGSDEVEAIAEDVERLRELDFERPPEVEFMTRDELSAYVGDVARAELDDVEVEAQVAALARLGLVPEDFDVERLIELTSGQVLGLYEPETSRLLIRGSRSIDPRAQLTIAHELDHALTDQVLGFPDLRWRANRADAQLAQRALIEGDATLLMQHYGMVEFPDEVADLLAEGTTERDLHAYRELPYVLQRSLSFPYVEGYLFACELHSQGGWSIVDRAYASPPGSTLEILYPGLYGEVDAHEPDEPPSPGAGWSGIYSSVLGAADLQWMFEAPAGRFTGNMVEAAGQVSRWRGGRFSVWQRDDDLVVVMAVVEGPDLSGGDSPTICHRLVRWYTESQPDARFLDGRGATGAWSVDDEVAAVDCEGDQARFVAAPDLRTALRIVRF